MFALQEAPDARRLPSARVQAKGAMSYYSVFECDLCLKDFRDVYFSTIRFEEASIGKPIEPYTSRETKQRDAPPAPQVCDECRDLVKKTVEMLKEDVFRRMVSSR